MHFQKLKKIPVAKYPIELSVSLAQHFFLLNLNFERLNLLAFVSNTMRASL